jgi:hypothetical protein
MPRFAVTKPVTDSQDFASGKSKHLTNEKIKIIKEAKPNACSSVGMAQCAQTPEHP